MTDNTSNYYIPEESYWPIIGSVGLFTLFWGAAQWLHNAWYGPYLFFVGALIVVFMLFGWFSEVIGENQKGLYNKQVDRTYRWAMSWFIFSEVCFFFIFFAALFYARFWSVPSMGGEIEHHLVTHYLLWPEFKSVWPLLMNPDNVVFPGAENTVDTWHLPALNTLILLMSGVTITWAHWALKKNARAQLILGMFLTVALGVLFLYLQALEYKEAYHHLDLTLDAGIYGTTFFMLTGFHGAHVTLGTIMLIVILGRCMKGHFTAENHFAFEGVAWYWHFVDVVWLFLFIFVYWL